MTILIAVTAVAAGFVVLPGQHARMTWRTTSIAPPRGFDGLPRTDGPSVTSLLQRVAKQQDTGDHLRGFRFVAGLYGNGTGETILILASKAAAPLTASGQQDVRQALTGALTRSGTVTLTERDPGELGGWFGCGRRGGVTACVATDAASAVAVLVVNDPGQPEDTALRIRQATVRR